MEIFIVALIVVTLVYAYYTRLVSKKNAVLEALAGIDVQLNMRADLVPNILKIAKRFLEHESKLLAEITALRTSASRTYDRGNSRSLERHLSAAAELEGKMSQLMVTLENYPDLKSDRVMTQAQETYSDVEQHIAAARRFYNSAVSDLNTAVQIFPGSLIAGMAGIEAMPFFEATATARQPIDADSYLR